MSCFIHSESKDIPVDFWNHKNITFEQDEIKYLSLNDAQVSKINKREGNG